MEYVCEITGNGGHVVLGESERVVRCRDCVSWDADEGWCNGFDCSTEPDGFCRWGERREP